MHDIFVPSQVSGFCYLLQMYVLICVCFRPVCLEICNFDHHTRLFFLFFYKNVVFPGQAEYSYFPADFRL